MWVKTGNVLPYFPYDLAAHTVNFKQKTGLLPPVAKLQVKDVVQAREPVSLKPGEVAVIQKKIMAVFEKSGEPGTFAAGIGLNTGDDFSFPSNDMVFFESTQKLYKQWPADTWTAMNPTPA